MRALVLAGVVVAVMTTAPAAPARELVIGLTDNAATLQDLPLAVAHAEGQAALGAPLMRTGVNWNVVNPRKGQWRWGFYDALYEALARRGVQVLPVLLVTPRWQGAHPGHMPRDPAAYARYVRRVVARYGPGGAFWRAHSDLDGRLASRWFNIWNEPYLWMYSTNGVDAGKYARLVKAAVKAARAVNSTVRFLLEAELSWQPGRTSGFTGDWIAGMYDAVPDLNAWFDAVSVHPYSGSLGPERCSVDPAERRWQFCRIRDIHRRFAARGAADKPLWITEIGWATCQDNPSKCVTADQQATFLATMFQLAALNPRVQAVLPYTYQDSTQIPGDLYGMHDSGGRPKPALNSFRFAIRVYGRRGRLAAACGLLPPLGPLEPPLAAPCAR